MDFKPVNFSTEYANEYWDGMSNLFIRHFSYLRQGLGLVNEAKNYFLIVFGTMWTAEYINFFGYKLNSNWILIAGIVGIPILVLIGRWDLFKATKSRQYITTIHGSITQFQGHNMNVFQTLLMKSIAEKMGVDVKRIEEELSK